MKRIESMGQRHSCGCGTSNALFSRRRLAIDDWPSKNHCCSLFFLFSVLRKRDFSCLNFYITLGLCRVFAPTSFLSGTDCSYGYEVSSPSDYEWGDSLDGSDNSSTGTGAPRLAEEDFSGAHVDDDENARRRKPTKK